MFTTKTTRKIGIFVLSMAIMLTSALCIAPAPIFAQSTGLTYDADKARQWEEYCSNYIYNKLSSDEKKAYQAAYNLTMEYLLTDMNAGSDGYTKWVNCGTENFDINKVYSAFATDCTAISFFDGCRKDGKFISLKIKEFYRNGKTRSQTIAKRKSGLDKIYDEVVNDRLELDEEDKNEPYWINVDTSNKSASGNMMPIDNAVINRAGVCVDIANTQLAIYSRLGYEATYLQGPCKVPGNSAHAWIAVRYNDGWFDDGQSKTFYVKKTYWELPFIDESIIHYYVDLSRTKSNSKPELSKNYSLLSAAGVLISKISTNCCHHQKPLHLQGL